MNLFIRLLVLASFFPLFSCSENIDVKEVGPLLESVKEYNLGEDYSNFNRLEKLIIQHNSSFLVDSSLVAFINSDATPHSKRIVSRLFAKLSADSAFDVLFEGLKSPSNNIWNKFALSSHGSANISKRLKNRFSVSDDSLQLDILLILGKRKSDLLIEVGEEHWESFSEKNKLVFIEAASGLSSPDALKFIDSLITQSSGNIKEKLVGGFINVADEINFDKSNYEKIIWGNYSSFNREAALISLINRNPVNALDIIRKVLLSDQESIKTAAIKSINKLDGQTDLSDIYKILGTQSAETDLMLIAVFEERAQKEARNYIIPFLNSENEMLQKAAIKSIKTIGNEEDLENLINLLPQANPSLKKIIYDTLFEMKGNLVNKKVLDLYAVSDSKKQIELVKCMGGRKINESKQLLFDAARSENRLLRNEAYKALEVVANNSDIDSILNILTATEGNSDRIKIENALVSIVNKNNKAAERGELVIGKFSQYDTPESEISKIRVLGRLNDDTALKTIIAALEDENELIRLAAIQSLEYWHNAEPLKNILAVLETETVDKLKSAAIKTSAQLIQMNTKKDEATNNWKLEQYKLLWEKSSSDNDKRWVVSGLGTVLSYESINFLMPLWDEPKFSSAAEKSIVNIIMQIYRNQPAVSTPILKTIMEKSADPSIRERAKSRYNFLSNVK